MHLVTRCPAFDPIIKPNTRLASARYGVGMLLGVGGTVAVSVGRFEGTGIGVGVAVGSPGPPATTYTYPIKVPV